jgi:toxin YoeB
MSEKPLEFDKCALEDLSYWIEQDRRKALKIMELIEDIHFHPFEGLGKPEPLKFHLSGCWSRRIDLEHRLIYHVKEDKIRILSCRYHYR